MRLQHQLVLPQARIRKVRIDLGAENHTVTLEIQAALTRDVAESFGCRELIYVNDTPRSGVEKMVLEGSENDCDVRLKHDAFAFQTVVHEMGHYAAHFEGDGPKLRFQVKFTGYVITVADMIEHVRVDPLEITLKPAQLDLGLQGEGAASAEGGACVDCANEIPLAEGDPSHHASGQPCENFRPAESTDGPALASVTEMGVGSHQKGNPKKHGRRQPKPEEEADFISEVIQ